MTVQLPAWRGGAVLDVLGRADLERYTRLGIALDDFPSEDALDYLEQIVGYAWKVNMSGTPAISTGQVSVHDALVVFDADVRGRNMRTRTRADATHDFVRDLKAMYGLGSPIRRDGTRLVTRPAWLVFLPFITEILVG